jgi:tRNA pseudouridine55 synthase
MDRESVERLLKTFEGDLLQAPPAFSALRVDGVRAHRHARRGRAVDLEPRRVAIHRIALVAIEDRDWILEVACGPGVYIRSLARDLGAARGCGAYLASLRRTRSGSIRVEDAVRPSEADLPDLKPLSEVLSSDPRTDVSADEALALLHGKVIHRPAAPDGVPPRFAWFRGQPCYRLVATGAGMLRSDLLIEDLLTGAPTAPGRGSP